VFLKLKDKKTKHGSTLLDVIQSGCANPDSHVGVYAPDAEAYKVFSDLFTPLIVDYHGKHSAAELKQPPFNMGNISRLYNIDPDGEYIKSTRCRVARTIEKLPLNPMMTEDNYRELEEMMRKAMGKFTGDLAGKYNPLITMSKEKKNELIKNHFLFKEGDKYLEAANALNYWPVGRGIYLNEKETFLIWCGEEDHMRVISMQQGADIREVVSRLDRALAEFSENFKLARHEHFGFLTFCPTNLGTTIRASFHIKLPKLGANMALLNKKAAEYNLQIRGIHGEGSESVDSVFDISNKRRLGFAECDVIDDMHKGCEAIINLEKSL
jgi:protein-arginine kinase